MNKGFTIVELLVVVGLLAVVGTVLTDIFLRSLRGGNKAEVIARMKQNGQATMDHMGGVIRSANSVVCPQTSISRPSVTADTVAVEKDGTYTRFRFLSPTSSESGKIVQDHPAFTSGSFSQFLVDICSNANYSGTSTVAISDTNTKTGVSIINGVFIRNQQSGVKDTVNLSFDVKHGIFTPDIFIDQIDPVTFRTTVELR